MDVRDAQFLYAYNRWANARVLDASVCLVPEQFTRNLGSSFPCIRDTLVHILSAEWIWLRRWTGTSPRRALDSASFGSLDTLRARWAEVEVEQTAFVDQLTPEVLEHVVSYTNVQGEMWRYPLGQMLQHVVNHSTYHRGQVTTMLRQLGATPATTDLLVFVDHGQPGWTRGS